jgi:glycosyltransferase involved in cell wall biosynthesis
MLVGPWPPTNGGTTTFMLNVVNSPLKKRYKFIRFTTSRPPKKNVVDNYGYGSLFNGGIIRLIQGVLITAWHLVIFPFVMIRRNADVVQVQASDFQTFWEAALYVIMCRVLRRPVLLRLGGAFDHFYEVSSPRIQKLIRLVVNLPNRLIVQSLYWRELISRLGRNEGVVVLANFVPSGLTETVTRPIQATPVCLFIASAEAMRKGLAEVLPAVHILMERNIPVRFHFLAAAPKLREQLSAEGVSFPVKVEGYVSHDQMLTAMRAADIFLLPSRGEGFPNSLLEAMALGLACIAAPVGAVPEVVGANGAILVPVRNSGALADAIERLALDPRFRQQIADQGRAIVRKRYVANRVLPVLDQAWTELLRAKSGSARPDGLAAQAAAAVR